MRGGIFFTCVDQHKRYTSFKAFISIMQIIKVKLAEYQVATTRRMLIQLRDLYSCCCCRSILLCEFYLQPAFSCRTNAAHFWILFSSINRW